MVPGKNFRFPLGLKGKDVRIIYSSRCCELRRFIGLKSGHSLPLLFIRVGRRTGEERVRRPAFDLWFYGLRRMAFDGKHRIFHSVYVFCVP